MKQRPAPAGDEKPRDNPIMWPLRHAQEAVHSFVRARRPAITDVVREATAGGVVFRRNLQTQAIEFLLIQDGKDRWTISKGHIEPDEPPEETAVREILEETGVRGEVRVHDWLGKVQFQYRREQSLVLMTMQVFLIEMSGDDTDHLFAEDWIHSVRWFSQTAAVDAIEYPDLAKLILLGLKRIRSIKH